MCGISDKEPASLLDIHSIPLATSHVLATCHSLLYVDDKLIGDPIERATLAVLPWTLTKGDVVICRTVKQSLKILKRFHFNRSVFLFGNYRLPRMTVKIQNSCRIHWDALYNSNCLTRVCFIWYMYYVVCRHYYIIYKHYVVYPSSLKRMSVLVSKQDASFNTENLVMTKGAPEVIKDMLKEVEKNLIFMYNFFYCSCCLVVLPRVCMSF